MADILTPDLCVIGAGAGGLAAAEAAATFGASVVLVERGKLGGLSLNSGAVPAKALQLDPLGRRTWDSVRRARDVFGARRLIIVSQRDHLARALFLARHLGLRAWGVAARDTDRDGLYEVTTRNLAGLLAYYDVIAR